MRVYTLKLIKEKEKRKRKKRKKRHSWLSVKILKMPSNWPTFEGVFFSS